MKKNIIFILISIFLFKSCSEISDPIYTSKNQEQISNEWKIILYKTGRVGSVEDYWFGNDFYAVEFGIRNNSEYYRFLKFFNQEMDKTNLLASLQSDTKLVDAFRLHKDQFVFNDFTNFYDGISIYFSLPTFASSPEIIFDQKLVFPPVKSESNLYKVAFVASEFGIPMKNSLVNESPTSSGWMEPGEYRKFKLYFSVPSNAKLEKMIFPNVFEAELTEN